MSAQGRERRFAPTVGLLAGSLLLWLANFVVVYVVAALACARGFAAVRLLGLPIVPLVTIVASLATGIASGYLLHKGLVSLRAPESTEQSRFIGFVALMTSVMAIVALVLLMLPPMLMSACTSP